MFDDKIGNPDLWVLRILLLGSEVAHDADSERRQIGEVILGQVSKHAGSIHQPPAHKLAICRLITAKIAEVRSSF